MITFIIQQKPKKKKSVKYLKKVNTEAKILLTE